MVVCCPYCVEGDGFRPMVAHLDGRCICAKCGHLAILCDKDFKCSCPECSEGPQMSAGMSLSDSIPDRDPLKECNPGHLYELCLPTEIRGWQAAVAGVLHMWWTPRCVGGSCSLRQPHLPRQFSNPWVGSQGIEQG